MRIVIVFLMVFVSGCLLDSKVYLSGGLQNIGAAVEIDGQEVGRMKAVDNGAIAIISVSAGRHELKVIRPDGSVYVTVFVVQGEEYLSITE